ncbi:RND transporter, partial [Staphylococcus gallinarum]
EQNLELARRANALGGAASTAKVAAQTQLESDRTQLPGLRSQLGAARHALALLVGRAPADWTAPEFDLAEFDLDAAVPVSLPSQLVRKRP